MDAGAAACYCLVASRVGESCLCPSPGRDAAPTPSLVPAAAPISSLKALVGTADSPLLRRLVWNLVPLAVVVAAVATTLMGEDGLLRRHALKQRLLAIEDQLAQVEQENEGLAAEVRRLREDPSALRRAAAEELLVAEPGSTIYRFAAQ